MSIRDRLRAGFGPGGPQWPLFYSHPPALRFELSQGGSPIRQFRAAMDRALTILAGVFPAGGHVTAVFRHHGHSGDSLFEPARGQLHALRRLGIAVPRAREIWLDPLAEPEEDALPFVPTLAFEASAERLEELLWGALAVDLGIHPRHAASLYLFDPASGLLAHPYDDRGLDLAGPKDALLPLYHRHRDWLLDYDRAAMDAVFGNTQAA